MRFLKEQPNAHGETTKRFLSIAAFLFVAVSFFMLYKSAEAAPVVPPSIITYQGKVLSAANTPITTALNFQFLLYDAPMAGNLLYTAGGTLATPAAISITPSSGVFAVDLGGTETNPIDSNIFRTHSPVYLEVVIGAETLTPRRPLSSAPYAINALSLNGYALDTVSSSVYIPLSDSEGNFQFNGVAAASSTLTQATINNLTLNGSVSGLSLGNITGTGVLAYLANNQSFSGTNLFSATTTFTTTTIASTTATNANITTLTVNGSVSLPANSITDAMVSDSITASNYLLLTGGTLAGNLNLGGNSISNINDLTIGGTLAANGPVTIQGALSAFGTATFSATSTFTTSTIASSSITTANITNLSVNGTVSGISIGSITGNGLLAYLANDQTLSGLNTFAATTTFTTTTIASSTVTQENAVNLSAANATITNLLVNGTCTGCLSGAAMLAANQTFTGINTFSVTTTFSATSSFSRAIGIATTTSQNAQLTLSGGNILAIGDHIGSGPVPYSGVGTRMMWIPSRTAFRAGYVNGSQWDAANVGVYSAAFGENNTASGDRSFVGGTGNTVSGTGSVSFGGSNTLTGGYSAAIGNSNNLSGSGSGIALGQSNSLSGFSYAIAIGISNTVSGSNGAVAIGNANTVGGNSSVALGQAIRVNGNNSVGIGLDTTTRTMTANNIMSIMGGNVGIGTLAPGYTLAVTGTLAVSATSTFSSTTMTSSTITTLNVTSANIGTLTVGSCTGCGGAASGASLTADQTFTGANTFNAPTVFTSNSGILVNTSTAFASGRLYIDSSGNIFSSGTLQVAGNILPLTGVVTSTAIVGNASSTSSTIASTGDVGAFPSATVGSDGFPVVSYYDATNADLIVGHCSDVKCSSMTTVSVDTTGSVGASSSLAIGADGFPVVTYYDETNSQLKFAKCTTLTCSQSIIQVIDNTAGSGISSSVVIGADNLPVIFYYISSVTDLYVKHCATNDCSSIDNTYQIDANGGRFVKALIYNKRPFGFYMNNNNDFYYFKCYNIQCTSLTTANIQFNTGDTSGYISATLNKDGLPIASFYHASFNSVYLSYCNNADCSTFNNIFIGSASGYTSPQAPWTSISLDYYGMPTIAFMLPKSTTVTNPYIFSCGSPGCVDGTNGSLMPFGASNDINYTKGMALFKSSTGVLSSFYYDSNNGDLKFWQGCGYLDFNSSGCQPAVAVTGSYLGTSKQHFYRIYSQEIYAKQAYLSGFDLAESYLTNDPTLKPGDVVAFDENNPNRVVKADVQNHPVAVGIISTKPGLLLTEWGPDDPVFASGTKMVSLALAGRVPVVVSGFNGSIAVGDKLSASSIPGVAVKALPGQPTIGIAMESFPGTEIGSITAFVNIDTAASDTSNLRSALTVDASSSTLRIGASSTPYDLALTGNLSLLSTGLNTISFAGTALLTSQVQDVENAKAFILNAQNLSPSSAPDRILFSLRAHDTPVFSVAANGDVHTNGNYFGAGAVFGSSTNPGDLAERVDIASDDSVEAGDVMIVDANNSDTYRRSRGSYDPAVAGVISSNPTIVVGRGKTEYTANLAMVGRVPVKVNNQNGSIQRGDLLVASAEPGYAMKYDPTLDNSQKMVGVIGIALDPMTDERGKVAALIRTGWAYSQNKNITALQTSIDDIAAAAGIDLNKPAAEKLHVETKVATGELVYLGGNLNLRGNSILNVAAISAPNKAWSIDDKGHFITKLTTASGEQTMYAMQSPASEFVFSSSSALIGGEAEIVFDQLTEESIDPGQPLKVTVTLTSEGAQGVYVSEKSVHGFTIKEVGGGKGNATFDWIVVAKRREDGAQENISSPQENTVSETPVEAQPETASSTPPTQQEVTAAQPVAETETVSSTPPVVESVENEVSTSTGV